MATSIVTANARKKMAQARAGIIPLPTITGIAFGDGGVDSSGNPTDVAASATGLNHELLRKAYDSKEFVSDTACRYSYTLKGNELAGNNISEIGLYDSNGDIVNIKHFMSKGKDSDLEITFQVDDEF